MSYESKAKALKSSKDYIISELKFTLSEDPKYVTFQYKHASNFFELLYYKAKDIAIIRKNGKSMLTKDLSASESIRYKIILEIAIAYHHDREGAELQ